MALTLTREERDAVVETLEQVFLPGVSELKEEGLAAFPEGLAANEPFENFLVLENQNDGYGLPDKTGPLWQQIEMVRRTITRLAFPAGSRARSPVPSRREDSPNRRVAAEDGTCLDRRISSPLRSAAGHLRPEPL